jgi:hypothetical protein
MVKCEGCGKPIDKIPSWMSGIQVSFVCNNCPNRQAKNIAFLTFEPTAPAKVEEPDLDIAEADEPEDL